MAAAPEAVRLAGELLSAATPVFTPDGQQLVFISHQAAASSGVHNATAALHSLPWPQVRPRAPRLPLNARRPRPPDAPRCPSRASKHATQQPPSPLSDPQALSSGAPSREVVPVVPGPVASDQFPGLYCTSLTEQPFLDSSTLVLTTQWRSQTAIVTVDLASGAVTPITPLGPQHGSWTLLGLQDGLLAASHSAAQAPPQLRLCCAAQGQGQSSWVWQEVEELAVGCEDVPEVAAALANVETVVLQVTPTVGDPQHVFEAVLQLPRSRTGGWPPGPGPWRLLWRSAAAARRLASCAVCCGAAAGAAGFL
jgi:acylaminoacyl-peptidase